MNRRQEMLFVATVLNSALYLAGVFLAGLVTGNGFAWRMAIAATGMTYVCYLLQFSGAPAVTSLTATIISIIFGTLAGTSLLW